MYVCMYPCPFMISTCSVDMSKRQFNSYVALKNLNCDKLPFIILIEVVLFFTRYRTIKRNLASPASESPMKIPVGGRPRTSSVDRLMSDLAPIHEDAPLHSPSGGSPARMTQTLPITGSRVGPIIIRIGSRSFLTRKVA